MATVPFHLQYELSRRQRLIPLLRIWGPFAFIIPLCLVTFLYASISISWLFFLLIPICAWPFRNMLVGFIDVVFHRTVSMDLQVEQKGVGLLVGDDRCWLFLDGFV